MTERTGIEVAIGVTKDGRFILDFGQPVQTLDMPVTEAEALSRRILKAIKTIRTKRP